MRRFLIGIWLLLSLVLAVKAQKRPLVNTSNSPFAKLKPLDMHAVQWTSGFWAERFEMGKKKMVPQLWKVYNDAEISHAYKNFEIAAGLDTGSHQGPSFHDGDYYKMLEAVASLYATTKNPQLDTMMDQVIETIARSQREDGYIYTLSMIEQRKTGKRNQFEDRLSFEAYNIGHLMTAACIHYRATGKRNLLEVAVKATDYLYKFYKTASPTLARNAICPSHYMGVVEMYRTLGDERYIDLAKHLIDIKGAINDGTDDNQDRIPFREQEKVMGHAVRANYLYAGVADVYAETGDSTLLDQLCKMWEDVTSHKMYITGGCGSLYDGVSPDGTSYNPAEVQKIHQAYGRDYQLPNFTAHNETCANIGNMLWNWRMLQLTGDAKYMDVFELALYNSVLSGISLDGKRFLYTNPLAYSDSLPFEQRWSKDRVEYISLSNCCPPNTVRTLTQIHNYAYNISEEGLWVNLYSGNELHTNLLDGSKVMLRQQTEYPWNGEVELFLEEVPDHAFSFFLRIPGWTETASVKINGEVLDRDVSPGSYLEINRLWKEGDRISLVLPMEAVLMQANPLVEENRNQVAVKRGPLVYCLESVDLPEGDSIFDVVIPAAARFSPQMEMVENSKLLYLRGEAQLIDKQKNWDGKLYRKLAGDESRQLLINLVPYFAWGNRGHTDMTVWMPVR
ncbi:glycoside hydrolase family 127 protein [Olivibacter sp. SDN3]|uniref:aceric acid hydrolase n=1 Tax=Olivibacter sp. SDN3 TaxID=2764720 RepID=UPI0016514F2C|nr:glycoside hydrolase family 127 protein [Olivibacter sp. SDN3]QNL52278.1 glycoside hydrolase family 127 protein [Olivibacter sp. SDN3]